MELFVKSYFYMGIISVVLLLLTISMGKYPRIVENSLGADIVKLFISTGFLIWSTYLLHFSN